MGSMRRVTASCLIVALGAGMAGGAAFTKAELPRIYAQEENESATIAIVPEIMSWSQMRDTFGGRRAVPVHEAGTITLDGELTEWAAYAQVQLPAEPAQIELNGWTGEADLSADV
ncbi:hypothetical protein PA598K_06316 [Paenibacillus sp. 598K]|nr:hypothetical protein PA598K_06316 [Paenibacillus sp. 598K]